RQPFMPHTIFAAPPDDEELSPPDGRSRFGRSRGAGSSRSGRDALRAFGFSFSRSHSLSPLRKKPSRQVILTHSSGSARKPCLQTSGQTRLLRPRSASSESTLASLTSRCCLACLLNRSMARREPPAPHGASIAPE